MDYVHACGHLAQAVQPTARACEENEVGISVVLAVASDTTTTYDPHEGYQPYAAIIS